MKQNTEYDKLVAPYKKDLRKSLEGFVAINSVYDEKTKDETNPFGQGVSKALNFFYELAKKDGFEATNYKNKIVEVLVGKGKKNLTIMAHADVVPEGTGWDVEPYAVTEKNGVLFGRGVADDKGPLLAAYYAMKALRDNNLLGDYQVRFLCGGNEESGSLGVEYYFHDLKKPEPDLGFSPDSSFPLIFAEKGIFNFAVTKDFDIPHVYKIKGGVATNSVIERCEVEMDEDKEFIAFLKKNNENYEEFDRNGHKVIAFIGKAAHGSIPWCGVNAAMNALKALASFYKDENLSEFVKIYEEPHGAGFKADRHNDEMFDNSSNLGLFSYENKHFEAIFNFRFINSTTFEEMCDVISHNSGSFEAKLPNECSPLLYFPKDSVLVSTLLKAYQDETGDYETGPIATGGGTYAKETSNLIAFGMEFPGWESNMHSPGEQVKVEQLEKGMSIYARAIIELGKKL